MAPRPYPVHLVTACHGLWGAPSHIAYIKESVARHAAHPSAPRSRTRDSSPDRRDDVKVVVLVPETNAVSFAHTYDGVDVCADRVVDEIDAEISRIELDGGRVERFSIVGYSLGGLVARYVLGILESRTPSFFDNVRPVNFATFASPAIGIPQYKTFWSSTFRFLGSRLLSRTGNQIYERDRFLPEHFNPDASKDDQKPRAGLGRYLSRGRGAAEPLLKIMADPRYSFYRALSRFERIEIFANTVNDRTVPFPTGGIEAHDPFALARAKAQKVAQARGDDPDAEIDIRDGGLDLTLHENAPIIASYKEVPAAPIPSGCVPAKRRFRLRLPLLLRPTTYPFSRPVSLLVIAFLPIALPLSVVYLVGRFMLQSRESRRRIRDARKRLGGGREGMLQRVGVQIGEVAELAGVDNPEYAGGLSVEGTDDVSNNDTGESAREANESTHFGPQRTYGSASGTSTPALARPVSPPSLSPSPQPPSSPSASSARLAAPFPDTTSEAARYSTDPVLSSSQLFQLQNLNALPQLRKHLVYLPHARNSHGAIVRRDPNFAGHRAGRKVVDFWASEFRV